MNLICASCGLRLGLADITCRYCRQFAPSWQHVILVAAVPAALIGLFLLAIVY